MSTNLDSDLQVERVASLYKDSPRALKRVGSFGAWEDSEAVGTIGIKNLQECRIPSVKRILEDAPIQSPKSRLLLLDELLMEDEKAAINSQQGIHRETHSRRSSDSEACRLEMARSTMPPAPHLRRLGSLESNVTHRHFVRTSSGVTPSPEKPRGKEHRTAHITEASTSPPAIEKAPAIVRAASSSAKVAAPAPDIAPRVQDSSNPEAGTTAQMAISKEETLLPRRLHHDAVSGVDRLVLHDSDSHGLGSSSSRDDSDTRSQSNLSSASTQHSSASSFRRQCRRSQQLLHGLMATKSPAIRTPAAEPQPPPAKVPSAELSRASGWVPPPSGVPSAVARAASAIEVTLFELRWWRPQVGFWCHFSCAA